MSIPRRGRISRPAVPIPPQLSLRTSERVTGVAIRSPVHRRGRRPRRPARRKSPKRPPGRGTRPLRKHPPTHPPVGAGSPGPHVANLQNVPRDGKPVPYGNTLTPSPKALSRHVPSHPTSCVRHTKTNPHLENSTSNPPKLTYISLVPFVKSTDSKNNLKKIKIYTCKS